MFTSTCRRKVLQVGIPACFVAFKPQTSCEEAKEEEQKPGMRPNLEGTFHNLFPLRQLWNPKLPYPLWDSNWDNKEPERTGDDQEDKRRQKYLRSTGVTRHILLIRHGQYDETYKVSD